MVGADCQPALGLGSNLRREHIYQEYTESSIILEFYYISYLFWINCLPIDCYQVRQSALFVHDVKCRYNQII